MHHLSRSTRSIPNNEKERLASACLTNAEYLSLIGASYYFEIEMTLDDDAELWYRFVPPAGLDAAVISRIMMPELSGCTYELYSGTTGFTDTTAVTAIPFHQGVAVPSQSTITQITTPSTPGTKYVTPIRIGKGGANPNARTGGTQSSVSGFWVYPKGTDGFFARFHNYSEASNTITFRFEFAEYDPTLIP